MPSNRENYAFRALTPDDASQYRELRIEALRTDADVLAATLEEVEAESEAVIREDIARRIESGGFSIGVFTGQSDLVGLANVARPTLKRRRHIGIIWGVFVSVAHREQGLARKLLLETISEARNTNGLRQLHIEVVTTNKPAFELYQQVGFERYGTQPRAVQSEDGFHDEYLLALILR